MSFFSSFSQVESTAYGLMLKTLLSNSVPHISVAESTNKKAIFLDARAYQEFKVSHIKGAEWIGYEEFEISSVAKLEKSKPIIIYCSVGYRSEKIGEQLIKEGFKEVYNLYGGIFEWKNQGKVIVDEENNPTEKIHAYSKTWGIWISKGQKVY